MLKQLQNFASKMTLGLIPPAAEETAPTFDPQRWKLILQKADAHADAEQRAWDKFARLYKDGAFELDANSNANAGVSANITFAYVNMKIALLLAQAPTIEVEARETDCEEKYFAPLVAAGMFESPEDARRSFAEALEISLGYTYEEAKTAVHNSAILFDATVKGLGISKESYDPIRGIDRVDRVRRCDLFVDPFARYDLSQAQYVVETCMMPIDKARAFFGGQGVGPEKIEANWMLADGTGLDSEFAQKNNDTSKFDTYKFYEIWHKDPEQGRKIIYVGKDKQTFITEREWPFELDVDEFPYTLLAFNQQYTAVKDSFTELYTVEGMRQLYEDTVEFIHRHTRRVLAKKILVSGAVWSADKIEQLKNPKDAEIITLGDGDTPVEDLTKSYNIVDMNATSDGDGKCLALAKSIYDEILGQDEMVRGAETQEKMTATEAGIKDENSKLRTGRAQKQIDQFLATQTKHRASIQRQLLQPDKVVCIVGRQKAQLWMAYAGNAEDLAAQYSIGIQAGSTGERAIQQKFEDLTAFFALASEVNKASGAMPGMPQPYDLIKISQDVARAKNFRRPQKYLTPAFANGMPQQPMLPPMQSPNVTQMNPQQQQLPQPQMQPQGATA